MSASKTSKGTQHSSVSVQRTASQQDGRKPAIILPWPSWCDEKNRMKAKLLCRFKVLCFPLPALVRTPKKELP